MANIPIVRAGRGLSVPGAEETRARGRGGFTLVEVAIGIVLLTVAISGLLAVIVSFSKLVRANRESAIALQAAREMIEKMQDTTFSKVFATYNANPNDDPNGPGTAPGKNFGVRGLQPLPTDPDGKPGEILFPMVGAALREDVLDAGLSMPRDLNADGNIDAADHATNYVLLPVRVRVQWRGATGPRTLTIDHLLTNR